MAANMADLLQILVERGGSDLHLTTGTHPQIRVAGKLTSLTQFEVLAPQDTQRLASNVLNEGQNQNVEGESEPHPSSGIRGAARPPPNLYRHPGRDWGA